MRFHLQQEFPAPLAEVEAAFLDDAFLARLGDIPGLGRPEPLEERRDGDLVHRRVRYRFTKPVSSVVRRVVDPARLTWVEVSTTDTRTHRTTFHIEPDHYPDKLASQAAIQLTPAGQGTRRVTEGEVVVRVPLVGGRVERAIVDGLREHADAEVEVFRRWWEERGG